MSKRKFYIVDSQEGNVTRKYQTAARPYYAAQKAANKLHPSTTFTPLWLQEDGGKILKYRVRRLPLAPEETTYIVASKESGDETIIRRRKLTFAEYIAQRDHLSPDTKIIRHAHRVQVYREFDGGSRSGDREEGGSSADGAAMDGGDVAGGTDTIPEPGGS